MNRNDVVFVKNIEKRGAYCFWIEWTDGRRQTVRLSELQQCCPCMCCRGEARPADPALRARKLTSVGRYALRVEFVVGCSKGIYPFSLIRQLGGYHEQA